MSAEERAAYLGVQEEAVVERFRRSIPLALLVAVLVPAVGGWWAPPGVRWLVWLTGGLMALTVLALWPLTRVAFARASWAWLTLPAGCIGALWAGVFAAETGGFVSPAAGGLLVIWAFGSLVAPQPLHNFVQIVLHVALCALVIAAAAPVPGSPTVFLVLSCAGVVLFQINVAIRTYQAMHAWVMGRRLDEANLALARLNGELEQRVDDQVAEIREHARSVEVLNLQLQKRVIERSRELETALARLAEKERPQSVDVGAVLGGRFEIVREIGIGGMGHVFEGIDGVTGEPVAVKIILPERVRGVGDLKRFLFEARASAAISHEGIARTLDVDVTPDGTVFQVIQLLHGVTMADWLATAVRRPVGAVAAAGRILAQALAAAHEAGIVHRDIKPSNVMLTREAPGLKVLDFGVSKAMGGVEADPGVTRAHSILGTPAYMAPEQFTNVKNAGPAADVYSAGVLLYQAFTGARPFEGTTLETLFAAHATQAPRDIRSARADLPEGLAAAVTQCLLKDPTKRPAAIDLARALEPFAVDEELAAEAERCGVGPRSVRDRSTVSSGGAPSSIKRVSA